MGIDDMTPAIKALNRVILGCIPVIDDPFLANVRHHEIQKFSSQNYTSPHPKWIAIDDCSCFFKEDDSVFYTDGATGFNEKDIQPLINYSEVKIKDR